MTDRHYFLSETDDRLLLALTRETGFVSYSLHTGGGCMVAVVDLSEDARGIGKAVWLTREEDWLIGFYDFARYRG